MSAYVCVCVYGDTDRIREHIGQEHYWTGNDGTWAFAPTPLMSPYATVAGVQAVAGLGVHDRGRRRHHPEPGWQATDRARLGGAHRILGGGTVALMPRFDPAPYHSVCAPTPLPFSMVVPPFAAAIGLSKIPQQSPPKNTGNVDAIVVRGPVLFFYFFLMLFRRPRSRPLASAPLTSSVPSFTSQTQPTRGSETVCVEW